MNSKFPADVNMETSRADLRAQYLSRWAEKKGRMIFLLENASSGVDQTSQMKELLLAFHSLAGNGAIYGFPEISDTARTAEEYIEPFTNGGADLSPNSRQEITSFIERLDQIFAAAAEQPDPTPLREKAPAAPQPSAPPASTPEKDHVHAELQRIALVDRDPFTASELAKSLGRIRHTLLSWDGNQDLIQFLRESKPNVILMETNLGDLTGFDVCRKIKADPDLAAIPVLFMSVTANLQERVEGVRAGGEAFFAKPLSSDSFIESMEIMGTAPLDVPIRVLTAEDDPNQIKFNTLVLQRAGYLVTPCPNPENLLTLLETFNPDVLLMDVNMPHYNGFELARALRQDDRYLTLPIIFLTSLDEASDYIEGLQAGSDDYLVKPVDPQILLSCVRSRSKRSLMMRTFTDQDGLTRLLNRASLMRQLDGFFSRASRYGEIVSTALIDIDHFKKINDTHGHQAGDWILRDLARFLQEKLRDSDLIGRYGGEEFLIVLPRLPAEEAHRVTDRIRQEFETKEHKLPSGESLCVTFSGGIASFPDQGLSRDNVIAAADAALYEAKRNGRNRIAIATHINPS